MQKITIMPWLREPLLQFLLIGAGLFIAYSLLLPPPDDRHTKLIDISQAEVDQIREQWALQRRRQPSQQELNQLIAQRVSEEVLYREALAVGLDQNDAVIRRRLAQKIEFLTLDVQQSLPLDTGAIEAFYQHNRVRYQRAEQRSIEHVFFSSDARGNEGAASAAAALELAAPLASDDDRSSAGSRSSGNNGDSFALGRSFQQQTQRQLARKFGDDFAREVFALPLSQWSAPLTSAYGQHRVWVSEIVPTSLPELASIVKKVRLDWLYERRQVLRSEKLNEFQAAYTITVAGRSFQP